MFFLQANSLWGDSDFLIVIIIIALVIYGILKFYATIDRVTNHDQTPFEGLQFSTQEFYSMVEALIKEKDLPAIKVGRVYHSMYGTFSGKREYLRIQFQRYFFDICAAPFARDFFVSYRQGTLKVLIRRKRPKTFYEEDTENMFHASVLLCYKRAIEDITKAKGLRRGGSIDQRVGEEWN